MATVDYFLKIDGIDGESQDDKYKNQIHINSFSWGVANKGTSAAGGGSGAGKALFHDLFVIKEVDASSPKLMEACASGKHIGSVILHCRKAGGSQQEYYTITLTDVLVSAYQTSGCPAGKRMHGATVTTSRSNVPHNGVAPVPVETVSINFSKIQFDYKEQDSKGNVGGPVSAGYDLKANKAS